MTKVKVITSLEASEKVVKELLCLDVGVVGVNCKGSDVGPKGTAIIQLYHAKNKLHLIMISALYWINMLSWICTGEKNNKKTISSVI
jgi:hypothetical protein